MQQRNAALGAPVTIHLRGTGGDPGEQIGTGQVIHPQLVQVHPPLDDTLTTEIRRADEFVINTEQGSHPVHRIRPGLVGVGEAREILARELPQVSLADAGGLVVFETAEWLADDPDGVCDNPWWCKVLCLDSCSSC